MAIDEGGLDPEVVRELATRAATIFDEILGNPSSAEPFHRLVLAQDPLDERAFEALKQIFTDGEKWDDLQVLYRNRIAHTIDGDQKRELLLQVCFLFEELLDDPELAIRAYQDVVELEPDHVVSRRALDRLYRRTERWRDLAALLRQELDGAEGQDLLDANFELATLYEQKLEEPATAVDYYEQVLAENPTHLRSQEALERLISVPPQRQRIAAILEPLYEAQGAYAELARILEVQLEDLSDPGSQVGLLLRIAELAEVKNHDVDKAFSALSRAVALDPADGRAREELARVATIRERTRARRGARRGRPEHDRHLSGLGAPDGARQALRRAARRLGERREGLHPAHPGRRRQPRRGPARVEGPRAHPPRHQKFDLLAQDLRRQVELVHDVEEKKSLLVRLADLLEDTLEDRDGAIAAHRQRLDHDPADVDAMKALERLYERAEQWQRLIGVLSSHDNVTDDEAEQKRIALRIGEIYDDKLEDADNAIVAYNDALARFGADRDVLAALARLYEQTERWDDLLEVVGRELEQTEDPVERAGLRFRAAELMRQRTGEVERAIEAYAEVMRWCRTTRARSPRSSWWSRATTGTRASRRLGC